MRLNVKVVPKSSRNRIVGWMGDALKVCVSVPPERGQANAAVQALIAAALDLPEQSVQLIAGAASPRKVFEVAGLDAAEVRQRLERADG